VTTQKARREQALAWARVLADDHSIHVPAVGTIVPGTLHNECQRVTRMLLAVGPGYNSAITAWAHVAKRDRTSDRDYAGIPGYFNIGRYGHAVLMAGDGWCFSTDYRRAGRYDRVRIASIEKGWGAKWLGGAFTINGTRVYGSDPS
jgi:hypothetical protein